MVPGDGLRCKKVEVGDQKIGIFRISTAPAGQVTGELAQAYHCGSGSAGLGLRGAGTDSQTVCSSVEWGG